MAYKRHSRSLSLIDKMFLSSLSAPGSLSAVGPILPDALTSPENSSAGPAPVSRVVPGADSEPREFERETDERPRVVEMYGLPTPPKSYFFIGAGYAYGIGCGVGPFFGVGVAMGPKPLFGAGVGAGAYCGAGLGTGFLFGNGTGYIPYGASTSFFYTPRIVWAERIIAGYRYRNGKTRRRGRKCFGLGTVLDIIRRSFQKLR